MKGGLWVGLALFLASAQAQAETFSIAQEGEGRGAVLALAGDIPRDGDAQLQRALASAPQVRRVTLDSLGGSYLAGLAMGRRLRQAGLDTEVPAEATCQSACVFVLAGGVKRRIDRTATIGLHSHGDENWGSHFNMQSDPEGLYRLHNNGLAYVVGSSLLMAREGVMQLREMGVGPEVAEMGLANPSHGGRMCYLAHRCAVAWKLDNQTRLTRQEKNQACDLPPSLLVADGLAAPFQQGRFMGPMTEACQATP